MIYMLKSIGESLSSLALPCSSNCQGHARSLTSQIEQPLERITHSRTYDKESSGGVNTAAVTVFRDDPRIWMMSSAPGVIFTCVLFILSHHFLHSLTSPRIMKAYETSTFTLRSLISHPALKRETVGGVLDGMGDAREDRKEVEGVITSGVEVEVEGIDEGELELEFEVLLRSGESGSRWRRNGRGRRNARAGELQEQKERPERDSRPQTHFQT